jgi:MscS family membrane protein
MISEWYDKLLSGVEANPLSAYIGSRYLAALIIFLSFLALSAITAFVLKNLIYPLTKKTKTPIDDLIVEAVKDLIPQVIFLLGIGLALLSLGFPPDVNTMLVNVMVSIVCLSIVLCAVRITDIIFIMWGREWIKRTKSKVSDEILPLTNKAAKAVILIIGLMLILTQWGIDVMPFLAGLGIAGLAIGLALQGSLSNVFAGISLVLDRTFKVGDKVMLETGEIGLIHGIGLRSTKLCTFNNEVIIIPNSILANMRIKNYVRPDKKIRVNVSFSVEYGTDVKQVQEVVLGVIKKMDNVLADPPPDVIFKEMGESSLNFVTNFWIPDYSLEYGKKVEATAGIYAALNKAKIRMPFPTRTVYIHKEE